MAGLAVVLASTTTAANLDDTLRKMDQSAAAFRTVSAQVRRVHHTEVIHEDDEEFGTFLMKRQDKDVTVLLHTTRPAEKLAAFHKDKVEIYTPKINTVQEWDFGKQRNLVDQFLLLGFGTPGKELARNYSVKLIGDERVSGERTSRLELIPKLAKFRENFNKIELWVSDQGYPLQQKLYQPGGDYYLVVYSDLKWNPSLGENDLRLNLPKGVTRERPQK